MKLTSVQQQRQGDVLLVPASIPPGARRIPLRPLALGEVTGHSHAVQILDQSVAEDEQIEMYELDGRTFLRVTGEGAISIVHQEHGPLVVLPGSEVEVRIQIEETPDEAIRQVAD